MRIGVDARELQGRPTGTGRYLRNLLRAWSAGSDALCCYFNGPAPTDPVLALPAITSRPIGPQPVRGLAWQERWLPPVARADGLDVFFSPAYACPLALDVPRAVTVHDMSFFSLPGDFTLADGARRRALVAASIRAARRVIAVSEFTRREILAWFPEAADRVVRVAEGGDDDLRASPARAEARTRLRAEGPLVLAVGSILNRRRAPTLLHAIAALARRVPVTLDVVGDNRTHPRLDLAALARRAGVAGRVRFSGFVDEAGLADRYAAADAFVFLSEYEGFGLPVLEAMARGLPVVTASRPALSEIFAGAALFADPDDPGAVASALERALSDAPLRADLVARGRALAAGFSWDAAAAQTRAVLAEVARA